MKEKDFVKELVKWLKYNMPYSFGWEAKFINLSKKNKYYFNSDNSFKKECLNLQVCGSNFVHKFSDISRFGTPFDGIKLHNSAGYFFIQFWRPKVKHFYSIEICDLNKFIDTGAKHLDELDALNIGKIHQLYTKE